MDQLIAKFRELFPEFNNISDAVLEIYFDIASNIFNKCGIALQYLVAHLIATDIANGMGPAGAGNGATIDGGSGEVSSEKVGELQVTLKTMADRGYDTFFSTTQYGRYYLALRNTCPSYVYSPRTFPRNPRPPILYVGS